MRLLRIRGRQLTDEGKAAEAASFCGACINLGTIEGFEDGAIVMKLAVKCLIADDVLLLDVLYYTIGSRDHITGSNRTFRSPLVS